MPCGPNYGVGLRRLLTSQQRVLAASLPFYLRLKNAPDTQGQLWSGLGFSTVPTGAPGGSSSNPVVYAFTAIGVGTVHSITVGTQTYLFTETTGMTSAQLAEAMATVSATTNGLVITNDPDVSASYNSANVTLSPANDSGVVVLLAASDGNSQYLMWVTTNPSATVAATLGITDIRICPSPVVTGISMRDIGASMGKLRFGARHIRVAQAFVQAQLTARGLPTTPETQRAIWEGANVVGLVSENLLFSIETVEHYELGGVTIFWDLTVNANTIR